MERLSDMIPKLDAGMTPSELLREEYLGELGAATFAKEKPDESLSETD